MMQYYATFTPDGAGWLVTFRDLPEAITGGKTEAEAIDNARDALEIVLLMYADEGQPLPQASAALPGDRAIFASASVVAKVAFIETFRSSGQSRVALARRLGMLDPHHNSKLPALEAGLKALGRRLVVSVQDAA